MKNHCNKNLKGFTFVELLISVAIIVIIVGGAYLSPGVAGSAVTVNQGAHEIKNAIEELRNFAVGQHRDREKHYILIIGESGSVPYCGGNIIRENEYIICSTKNPDLSVEGDWKRVKGGNVPDNLELAGSLLYNNEFRINVRTFDGQIGFRKRYYDTNSDDFYREPKTITVNDDQFTRTINIEPLHNIVEFSG